MWKWRIFQTTDVWSFRILLQSSSNDELRGCGPHMTNCIEIIVQIVCFDRCRTFIKSISIFNARFAAKAPFFPFTPRLSFFQSLDSLSKWSTLKHKETTSRTNCFAWSRGFEIWNRVMTKHWQIKNKRKTTSPLRSTRRKCEYENETGVALNSNPLKHTPSSVH